MWRIVLSLIFHFVIGVRLAWVKSRGSPGLCVATLYSLISRGQLKSIKVGGRRLVTTEALNQLLSSDKPSGTLEHKPHRARKTSIANRDEAQQMRTPNWPVRHRHDSQGAPMTTQLDLFAAHAPDPPLPRRRAD